jgi:hypothetical protein
MHFHLMTALTHSSLSSVVFPFSFSLCGSRTMSSDLHLFNILKTLLSAISVKPPSVLFLRLQCKSCPSMKSYTQL